MDHDELGYGVNGRPIRCGIYIHHQSGDSDSNLRWVFEILFYFYFLKVIMLISGSGHF
jgi:hypothetical protein